MMLRFAVLAAFTLLGFYVFPGHTYLQSDTHIYLPMMERIGNPALLGNDIIATHPHLRYTVYDEIAGGLKQLTGGDFEPILGGLQLGARVVGLYGVYLLATAAGLETGAGLFLAGLFGLGALIIGPAVLTVEYEPIPRGMAMPLLLLAMGMAGHGRWMGSGVALGAAFVMHPPTVWPVWLVVGGYALWRGRGAVWGMVGGVVVLWVAAKFQVGETERQAFWATIPADLEALQRMRASYVWVGMWQGGWWVHHAVLLAVALAAWWRIRGGLNDAMRVMLLGLPLVGALSSGLSYLLLDLGKWIVVPQVQPARALLWVTMGAVLNGGIAAARAVGWGERFGWLLAPFALPGLGVWWIGGALAGAGASCIRRRWAWALIPVAVLAYPYAGGVRNYPNLHTTELGELSAWARGNTAEGAVFHFPDAGLALYPGIFRSRALRAVWVDRKGGGQVNFTYELAKEWWRRYDLTIGRPYREASGAEYAALGADYVVVQAAHAWAKGEPVFRNGGYVVYGVR